MRLRPLTKHVQSPAEVDADIVQHGTEASGESSEEDHTKVTGTDQVPIGRLLSEILAVYIETQDRTDGNDLCRECRCTRHESHEKDGRGAAFACDGHGCVWQDETIADLGGSHSLYGRVNTCL